MDENSGLSRLQQASELLLVTALNCPVGAKRCDGGEESHEESLTDLYTRYKRLQQLVHQRTVQLKAEKTLGNSQPPQSTDDLMSSISELEEELIEKTTERKLQTQLIEQLQLGAVLDNVLFTEDSSSDYHDEVKDLVLHNVELSAEIREEMKECYLLSHNLDKLQRQNLDKVEVGHRLKRGLDEIRSAKQKISSSRITSTTVKKYRDDVQESIKQIILIRNIFQGLIIGSGIDWAQDPETTETLLGLGDSIDNQLANYSTENPQ